MTLIWFSISKDEKGCVYVQPVGSERNTWKHTVRCMCTVAYGEKHTLNLDYKVFTLSKAGRLLHMYEARFQKKRQKRWCVKPSFLPTKASSNSCWSFSDWLSCSAAHNVFSSVWNFRVWLRPLQCHTNWTTEQCFNTLIPNAVKQPNHPELPPHTHTRCVAVCSFQLWDWFKGLCGVGYWNPD